MLGKLGKLGLFTALKVRVQRRKVRVAGDVLVKPCTLS